VVACGRRGGKEEKKKKQRKRTASGPRCALIKGADGKGAAPNQPIRACREREKKEKEKIETSAKERKRGQRTRFLESWRPNTGRDKHRKGQNKRGKKKKEKGERTRRPVRGAPSLRSERSPLRKEKKKGFSPEVLSRHRVLHRRTRERRNAKRRKKEGEGMPGAVRRPGGGRLRSSSKKRRIKKSIASLTTLRHP